MTRSLKLSSAIDSLFAGNPQMVVLSRRDAGMALKDELLARSSKGKHLERGQRKKK